MVNKSKNVGTAAESAIVKAFIRGGWPEAKRYAQRGSQDVGDIDIHAGITLEVKAGAAAKTAAESSSDLQVKRWLEETNNERRRKGADFGILIMVRRGVPLKRAEDWWAVMQAGEYADLRGVPDERFDINPHLPVRFSVQHAIEILREAGYCPNTPVPGTK